MTGYDEKKIIYKILDMWDFINEHMSMCPLKREKSNEQGIH